MTWACLAALLVLPPLPAFPVQTMEPAVQRQFEAALAGVEADARNADANGALGMLYHAYDSPALAEPCYRRAVTLAPDDRRWRFYLGLVLQGRGRWAESARELDAVLAGDPDDVAALVYRAEADLRLNRLDEAVARFQRASTLSPETPQAWCRTTGSAEPKALDTLAAALAALGRFPEAVEVAARALELSREQENASLAAEIESRLASYRLGETYILSKEGL